MYLQFVFITFLILIGSIRNLSAAVPTELFFNCENDKCLLHNVSLDKVGFYIASIKLATGSREGFWGISISTSSGLNVGGFNSGTVLRENGAGLGFMGFYLAPHLVQPGQTEAINKPVNLTVYEYSGNVSQMSVKIEKLDDNGTTSVYGPALMVNGQSATTQELDSGFYVASVASQAGDKRGRFGMSVLSDRFTGGINIGGWIDGKTGGTGEGFGAFYIATPQNVNFDLLFGSHYGAEGAGILNLEIFYSNPDSEQNELIYRANAPYLQPQLPFPDGIF